MRSVYALNEQESQAALKKSGDVIAASPWVRGNMEYPHRIVLRRIQDPNCKYVIHRQIIDADTLAVFFEHGNYFKDFGKDVWKKFDERCRRHMGIEEGGGMRPQFARTVDRELGQSGRLDRPLVIRVRMIRDDDPTDITRFRDIFPFVAWIDGEALDVYDRNTGSTSTGAVGALVENLTNLKPVTIEAVINENET